MSSSNNEGSLDGQESASDLEVKSRISGIEESTPKASLNMSKRVAAKELIFQYYSQLTEGCGNESCSNENCASSSMFLFKDDDKNSLALQAVTLSKNKARLCERRPSKISRLPTQEEDGGGGSAGFSKCELVGLPVSAGTKAKEPLYLTEKILESVIEECEACGSWSKLIHLIGSVFSNPESIIKSFRKDLNYDGSASVSNDKGDVSDLGANDIVSDTNDVVSDTNDVVSDTNDVVSDTNDVVYGANDVVYGANDVVSKANDVVSDANYVASGANDVASDAKDVAAGANCEMAVSANSEAVNYPVQESVAAASDIGPVITVDLPSLRSAYHRLMKVPEESIQGPLINALISLSQTVEMELKYKNILEREPNYINIIVVIMEIPMLLFPEYLDSAFPAVCKAIGTLNISGQAQLARTWATFGHRRLKDMVLSLQQLITIKVINNEGKWSATFKPCDDQAITSATKVLKILYYANILGGKLDSSELVADEKRLNEWETLQELMQGAFGFEPKDTSPPKEDPLSKELGVQVINCREPLLPYEDFINEPLNDNLDIGVDYTHYRQESENKFSFILYSFILTTASKHMSMYYDNRIRMLHERRTAFVQTLVHGGPPNPFLRVRVRRDHIIDDALVNLEMIAMENPSDLRKQLFVEFEGEQGLDEGGVSKEFFQLIVEELFNPDIGMFTYNEESHHFWFNSLSFENDAQFTLIGILLGLAIYNSCILDIHFPMVVYWKLMGKKGTFRDLYDVDPTLMGSLQQMLDYQNDDFEDVFDQTFCIGYSDVFGQSHTYNLREDGSSVPVTQANKQEFVDLYADYLLNKSIEQQFRAFKRGFLMVTSESPLRQLFRPEELEMLVCGSKIFDFHALEEATEYDGGFTDDSPTIRNFWTVVHALTDEDKKKLLQFTTGTDRVPIGGLSKLKMIIARNGPDSDRLPTSHTCFNVLLLPEYPTVEKLRDRLLKAINYSKGFGML